jgi:hypothetical protein
VQLSWLIPSLCVWLLVLVWVVGLCSSVRSIDEQLTREDEVAAR